jgi:hypothetical protein
MFELRTKNFAEHESWPLLEVDNVVEVEVEKETEKRC